MTKRMMMMLICRNTISGAMTMTKSIQVRNPLKKMLAQSPQRPRLQLDLLRPPDHLHLRRPVKHPVGKRTNDPIHVHDPVKNRQNRFTEDPVRKVVPAMLRAPNQLRPEPATAVVPVPGLRPNLDHKMALHSIVRAPITVRKVVRPFTTIQRVNTRNDRVVKLTISILLPNQEGSNFNPKRIQHVELAWFRFLIKRFLRAAPHSLNSAPQFCLLVDLLQTKSLIREFFSPIMFNQYRCTGPVAVCSQIKTTKLKKTLSTSSTSLKHKLDDFYTFIIIL